MREIAIVGLDRAKNVFSFTVRMPRELRCCERSYGPPKSSVFPEAAAVPGRNRSLRWVAPLGTGSCGTSRPTRWCSRPANCSCASKRR